MTKYQKSGKKVSYQIKFANISEKNLLTYDYSFSATVPPLASTSSTASGAFSILKDPAVFVPIVCAIVVVVVITVVVAVVMVLRRKDTTSECRSQGVCKSLSIGIGLRPLAIHYKITTVILYLN
ncbi:hypothetical protein TNCV_3410781 [Trichonephila clavipes]|nr:hypothetical protein TNCV_3410781 [Trichonephila clavipes]